MFAASKSGSVAPKDAQFNYVTMLLHGNGTNGAQNNTFLDSSTNNFTITRNGNTTQGSFSPYGSNWSNFFNASTALYNTTAPLLSSTASTFTAEAWVFLTATPTNASFPTMGSVITMNGQKTSTAIYLSFGVTTSNTVSLYWYDGAGKACTSSGTVTLNQWTHIAASVNANAITLYINGTSQTLAGTTTLTNRAGSVNQFTVGGNYYSTTPAYISNARVTNTAVYSSSFTPSTTPLTAISGTQLLTCQSNRFVDNSTNAYAFTVSGTPSVQRFNPFGAYTEYSTSVIGGSGYFDGTGDSLTAPTNFVLNGSFCIEAWFKTTTTTTYACIFSDESATDGTTILLNNGSNNGQITVYSTNIVSNFASTVTGLNNNAWHHVAFTRNGTTCYLFIDGVQQTTTTGSGTSTGSTARIGASFFASREFSGFIGDLRIVTGSAVYTSAFTPPTAPLTAISGTQLLLSTTNGAIFDNAMMNDLETVGNAQISTSVKKYGTGSIYFDGSGDRLYEPSNQNFNFGTGDFTIELWAYPISQGGHGNSNNDCLIDFRPATGGGAYGTLYIFNSGTGVYWYANTGNRITGGAISNSVWTHIAICRSAGSTRLFLNGVQSGSTYTDSTNYLVSPIMIGEFNDGGGAGNFNGYIDDLRITKGVARYTAAFTPPTVAFSDVGPT